MKKLTIRHLRYFEALATHRHFGRAAEASAISQPALSLQIRELETIMGGPMVERAARDIRLTALGEEVLVRARDILDRVDDLAALRRTPGSPPTGRIRFGVIPTIAPYLLPAIIQALSSRYPDLVLDPQETKTLPLIRDVLASTLDFAIVALPVSAPALCEFPLFSEQFLLVRPQSEAGQPVPSLSHLQDRRLLLLEEGHCFRDQALSFCSTAGVRPRQIMEGNSLSTLVQMVGAGIGLTLIPEMARSLETRSADVAVAPFARPAPSRTIGMIWREKTPLGEQFSRIGTIIRTAAQDGTDTPAAP